MGQTLSSLAVGPWCAIYATVKPTELEIQKDQQRIGKWGRTIGGQEPPVLKGLSGSLLLVLPLYASPLRFGIFHVGTQNTSLHWPVYELRGSQLSPTA